MDLAAQPAAKPARTPEFDLHVYKSSACEIVVSEGSLTGSLASYSLQTSLPEDRITVTRNGSAEAAPQVTNGRAAVRDPLDAMDDLEDAIEKVGEELPMVENGGFDSPARGSSPVKSAGRQDRVKAVNGASQNKPLTLKRAPHRSTEDSKRRPQSQLAIGLKRQSFRASTPSSSKPRQPSPTRVALSKTNRAVSSNNVDNQSARNPADMPLTPRKGVSPTITPNKATLSTSKPGFVPAKSAKIPTRPTFELPGEAFSRRMKAQREERLKREQEELERKRAFKASKIRYSTIPSPHVRETFTSRSRASLTAETPQKLLEREIAARRASIRFNMSPTRSSSGRTCSHESSSLKHTASDERLKCRTSLVPRTRQSSIGSGTVSRPGSKDSTSVDGMRGRQMRKSMVYTKTPAMNVEATLQKPRGKESLGRNEWPTEESECENRTKDEDAERAHPKRLDVDRSAHESSE